MDWTGDCIDRLRLSEQLWHKLTAFLKMCSMMVKCSLCRVKYFLCIWCGCNVHSWICVTEDLRSNSQL